MSPRTSGRGTVSVAMDSDGHGRGNRARGSADGNGLGFGHGCIVIGISPIYISFVGMQGKVIGQGDGKAQASSKHSSARQFKGRGNRSQMHNLPPAKERKTADFAHVGNVSRCLVSKECRAPRKKRPAHQAC